MTKEQKTMPFKTLKDVELKNKTTLVRVDLNVPVQEGRISDTTRIMRLKPTIDYLRQAGAKIVLLSHFGRPKGEYDESLSLKFLKPKLEEFWEIPVHFAEDCIGEKAIEKVKASAHGEAILLENLRFHKGEKENDRAFVVQLAELGDLFINDAFSAAHRAHASTYGLAHILPTAAGLLMEAELNALEQALGSPRKPVMSIVGGSKISTKLEVLHNLTEKSDILVLGGGMANTFLFAKGADMGNSLCEKDMADEARKIMAHAKSNACELILPADVVIAEDLRPSVETQIVDSNQIPHGYMALDIGTQTRTYIQEKIKTCKTVLWNGPLGVFETVPFDQGTTAVAQCVGQETRKGNLVSVAGGGDTLSALEHAQAAEMFSYLSTAGGAFLEWLEGKELPGVEALNAYAKAA